MTILRLICLIPLTLSFSAHAEVCKYVDPQGILHYTSAPPEPTWWLIFCGVGNEPLGLNSEATVQGVNGWWRVAEGGNVSLYVRRDSVHRERSGIVKAWFLFDYKVQDSSKRSIRSRRILYKFDCSERRLGEMSETYFAGAMGEGESLGAPLPKADVQPLLDEPFPGSLGAEAVRSICGI